MPFDNKNIIKKVYKLMWEKYPYSQLECTQIYTKNWLNNRLNKSGKNQNLPNKIFNEGLVESQLAVPSVHVTNNNMAQW